MKMLDPKLRFGFCKVISGYHQNRPNPHCGYLNW